MWPGMRPATGWIAYFTSTPRFSSRSASSRDDVLRLRDRQAVAGHDDRRGARRPSSTATSSAEVSRTGPVAARGRRRRRRRRGPPPNAPNSTFASERFIALHISSVSSVPEAPTSVPAMISALLREHEAGRGRREAGERVEQRDHDRHVGAADRQHQQRRRAASAIADHRRRTAPAPTSSRRTRPRARAPPRARRALTSFCAGQRDRPARQDAPAACRTRPASPRTRSSRRRAENMIATAILSRQRPSPLAGATWYSATATSAAAPPPTPLKSATICGISVICTRCARRRRRSPRRSRSPTAIQP